MKMEIWILNNAVKILPWNQKGIKCGKRSQRLEAVVQRKMEMSQVGVEENWRNWGIVATDQLEKEEYVVLDRGQSVP